MPYVEAKSPEHVYEIIKSNRKVILKFAADFCGHCKKIKDDIPVMANKYKDVVVVNIQTDNKDMAPLVKQYKFDYIPYFVPICGGSSCSSDGPIQSANLDKIEYLMVKMQEQITGKGSTRSKKSKK